MKETLLMRLEKAAEKKTFSAETRQLLADAHAALEDVSAPSTPTAVWMIQKGNGKTTVTCSECGQTYTYKDGDTIHPDDFKFCPECGRFMQA